VVDIHWWPKPWAWETTQTGMSSGSTHLWGCGVVQASWEIYTTYISLDEQQANSQTTWSTAQLPGYVSCHQDALVA
jgi:hypothetical protein